ncbi:hypothetical protein [Pleurocapsa sp. FMAR1]|uniref:hypothetical protein n=1 Tax=Pleurocapsa sp. FMAR1 TaxID=3040204 RepID=UPI0029C6353D|nr:hypothetical protein [Pleurocapsa sp. FMAR1]
MFGSNSTVCCIVRKNTVEIIKKYVQLAKIDKAIANTYLRTVYLEIYAIFT